MKKIWKILIVMMCLFASTLAVTSCQKDVKHLNFGVFKQNGYTLTSYATKQLSAGEFSALLSSGRQRASVVAYLPKPAPTDEDAINALTNVSNHIVVTTRFFEENSDEMQEEVSDQAGTVVGNYLKENAIHTATGLIIKNLYLTQNVLEFMETENANFKNSDGYANVPFANLYTYHTDENNSLIVQMHDFVDIPASAMSGGVNCYYRQDTEIMYEIVAAPNLSGCYARIRKWQTSLGAVISTAANSIGDGFVFEVEIEWIERN